MLQSAHPSTIEPSVVEEVSLLQPGITSPEHSNEVVSHFDQKIAHLSESPNLPKFSFTSVDAVQCRKTSFQPMTMHDTSEEMSAEGIDLLLMTRECHQKPSPNDTSTDKLHIASPKTTCATTSPTGQDRELTSMKVLAHDSN